MTGTHEAPRNPYVGPRAFEEDERELFFGRDEEIEILTGLVTARRAALFFAPSGAGKSSLLRAGLIPALVQQEQVGRGRRSRTYQAMCVLPIATVGGAMPEGLTSTVSNLFVFNVLQSLLPDADAGSLAALSLEEGLADLFADLPAPIMDEPTPLSPGVARLLIVDQFEEIFTHHPTRQQERVDFFQQVAICLEIHPGLHVLFTMREDHIAELTPYAHLLPDGLRPRFRLEFLGEEAARQAIQEPARQLGVEFSGEATTKLLNDLRRVRVQRLDGTMEEQAGTYVEPVQLQVVCRRLWENLPRGATRVEVADVEAVGDVDNALADYYADQVALVARKAGVSERSIRQWVERQLITEQGIRSQVLQGPAQSQGLDNGAIWRLVDAHLLRAEKRRGVTWFELAHDRLIDPVRKNNVAWRDAHLEPLQRQASLWEEQGRPEGLLLRGQALAQGKVWAETHKDGLEELEKAFIDESVTAGRLRNAKRLRVLLLAAVLVVVALAALAIVALFNASEARQQEMKAIAAQKTALAAQAESLLALDAAVAAKGTSDFERQAADGARGTAESGLRAALESMDTSRDRLETIQALESTVQVLSSMLTLTPSATRRATAPPTASGGTSEPTSPPATSLATPTPPLDQQATAWAEAATAQAIREQLAQIQETQTAIPVLPTRTPLPPLPSRSQIVFIRASQATSELYIMPASGEGSRGERPAQWIALRPCDTFSEGCLEAGRPRFKADSGQFIFQSRVPQKEGPPAYDLFRATLLPDQAVLEKNLTGKAPWDQMNGTWSPDGRQIAYLSTEEDLNRIWLMDADGGKQRPLTSGDPYKDEQPAWSPRGTWIAVVSQGKGARSWEIWLIDESNGDNRRQVTSSGQVNRSPAWSSNGVRLAFSRGPQEPQDICLINWDGTGERCHSTPWKEDHAAWSPDGNWIAFDRYVDDTYRTEIFIMSSDFSEEYRLTYSQAEDWGPVWVP